MKHVVMLETAMVVIKYAITPMACWPPPVGSSTSVIVRHNLFFWIGMIHLPLAISSSAYNVYLHRGDLARILKIMSEGIALCSVFTKMIICRIEAPRLRGLVHEMETFLKQATLEEREFVQCHLDKCLVVHAMVYFIATIGPLFYISGPLLTSAEMFPADFAYPFSVEPTWVFALVYTSQSITTFLVGSMVYLDTFFALLLWYASARFQILCLEFQKATTVDEVICCARQHQELLRYADQLKITASAMAAEVSIFAILLIAVVGFVLFGNPSAVEMVKYVFFELGAAVELFLLSWPADNLIEVTEKLGYAAFTCDWIGKSPKMLKNLLIVNQRSRNPIVISVSGLLPALSLEFYGSTVAASFSYLTTLRALTAD